jgi:hypothetical protein
MADAGNYYYTDGNYLYNQNGQEVATSAAIISTAKNGQYLGYFSGGHIYPQMNSNRSR